MALQTALTVSAVQALGGADLSVYGSLRLRWDTGGVPALLQCRDCSSGLSFPEREKAMSKAFTKESDADDEEDGALPAIPAGTPAWYSTLSAVSSINASSSEASLGVSS